MNESLTKCEIRQRSAELRNLLCEFDPIGVMDEPDWPRDEYDCMIGPIVATLQQGASKADIARLVHRELSAHFGLDSDYSSSEKFAETVESWYRSYWVSRDSPVTIYNRLVEEGTPVWRPVQARPLGAMAFRIISPDPRALEEQWEFPLGSVVRCEERVLCGENAHVVAVRMLHPPPAPAARGR